MAIGNPFNGTLRGRLGESVFSRKAGAQHVRAYVQKPANPQSLRQLAQRVKFGTCSKFYQHGVQNLFKFAFEFKKQGQDDYNAFLQANIGNVPCNTRKAYNMGMPNLGRYVMSVGSLPALKVVWDGHDPDTNHAGIDIGRVSTSWADFTIGQLSSAIISRYGLRDGDFITIAVVTSGAEPSQDLATAMERGGLTELDPDFRTEWKVYQFTLDVSSMIPASTLGIFSGLVGEGSLVRIADANEYNDPSSQGVCVMASRNTARGVKVSTSRMVVNEVTAAAIEVGMSREWTIFCAENFVAPDKDVIPYDNILQGSISENSASAPVLYTGTLPADMSTSAAKPGIYASIRMSSLAMLQYKRIVFEVGAMVYRYGFDEIYQDKLYHKYYAQDQVFRIWVDDANGNVYTMQGTSGEKITKIYLE